MDAGRGSSSTVSGPVIRLQILTVKNGQAAEQVVKRTSKGHEVVEIDGFTFIRKRALPPPEEPQPEAKKQQAVVHATPLPSATADQPAGSLAVGLEPDVGSNLMSFTHSDVAAAVEQQPSTDTNEDIGALILAQLQDCVPAQCSDLVRLQFVVSQLLIAGAARSQKPAGPHQRRPHSDVEQRVSAEPVADTGSLSAAAGPDNGISMVSLVHSVSGQFTHMLSQRVAAARAALAEAQPASLHNLSCMAPLLQNAAHGQGLAASLSAKLSALQQEEAQWQAVAQRYSEMQPGSQAAQTSSEPGIASQAMPGMDRGCQLPTSPLRAQPPPGPGPQPASRETAATGLDCARQAAVSGMMSQAECLLGLVNKVELLVSRAEEASTAMQAGYHVDKFQAFPHVNSPAWLIKRLVGSGTGQGMKQDAYGLGLNQSWLQPPRSPLHL